MGWGNFRGDSSGFRRPGLTFRGVSSRMGALTKGGITMSEALLGTESAAKAIQRVKYTHDAMIDLILLKPAISHAELATHFGYTQAWVSRIFCSDAFQARMAMRKADLVDPVITGGVKERIEGLAMQSLEIISKKLEATQNPDMAMKAFELSTKAAGYGARQSNVAVQNNFVVALPPKVEDPNEWATRHNGGRVVEVQTTER